MVFHGFGNRIGAGALVGSGALYMVMTVAGGHSATALAPPDLSAKDTALDIYRTLALIAKAPAEVGLVDLRAADRAALYPLPRAERAPKASVSELVRRALSKRHMVLIGEQDAAMAKLIAAINRTKTAASFHFLSGGARSWYLNLELPVELSSSKPPPFGYTNALATVKAWLRAPHAAASAKTLTALGRLSTLAFTPNLLAGKQKPKAGGAKKKIAGGCG